MAGASEKVLWKVRTSVLLSTRLPVSYHFIPFYLLLQKRCFWFPSVFFPLICLPVSRRSWQKVLGRVPQMFFTFVSHGSDVFGGFTHMLCTFVPQLPTWLSVVWILDIFHRITFTSTLRCSWGVLWVKFFKCVFCPGNYGWLLQEEQHLGVRALRFGCFIYIRSDCLLLFCWVFVSFVFLVFVCCVDVFCCAGRGSLL